MEFSEIGEKFEGLTTDQNKMVHTKEYLKKRDEILKGLYGQNCAERTKTTPIGQNTHAAQPARSPQTTSAARTQAPS